jgi:hypothetical protein
MNNINIASNAIKNKCEKLYQYRTEVEENEQDYEPIFVNNTRNSNPCYVLPVLIWACSLVGIVGVIIVIAVETYNAW